MELFHRSLEVTRGSGSVLMSSYHRAWVIPVFRCHLRDNKNPTINKHDFLYDPFFVPEMFTADAGDHRSGTCGQQGSAHCCLKTSSEQHFPRNWNVLGKQTGLLQARPSLEGFFPFIYFFLLMVITLMGRIFHSLWHF